MIVQTTTPYNTGERGGMQMHMRIATELAARRGGGAPTVRGESSRKRVGDRPGGQCGEMFGEHGEGGRPKVWGAGGERGRTSAVAAR